MIHIIKSVDKTFHAISFRDNLVILPIIDRIVNEINYHQSDLDKFKESEEEENKEPYHIVNVKEELSKLIKQYNVLSDLGFISSIDLLPTVELHK